MTPAEAAMELGADLMMQIVDEYKEASFRQLRGEDPTAIKSLIARRGINVVAVAMFGYAAAMKMHREGAV